MDTGAPYVVVDVDGVEARRDWQAASDWDALCDTVLTGHRTSATDPAPQYVL